MHNLDQSIAEWRKDMSRTRGLGPDTLDELESHLRETIHALVESGIPETEAVQRAMEQQERLLALTEKVQRSIEFKIPRRSTSCMSAGNSTWILKICW